MFTNILSRDHCARNWGHKDERDKIYSQKFRVDWRCEAHTILRENILRKIHFLMKSCGTLDRKRLILTGTRKDFRQRRTGGVSSGNEWNRDALNNRKGKSRGPTNTGYFQASVIGSVGLYF